MQIAAFALWLAVATHVPAPPGSAQVNRVAFLADQLCRRLAFQTTLSFHSPKISTAVHRGTYEGCLRVVFQPDAVLFVDTLLDERVEDGLFLRLENEYEFLQPVEPYAYVYSYTSATPVRALFSTTKHIVTLPGSTSLEYSRTSLGNPLVQPAILKKQDVFSVYTAEDILDELMTRLDYTVQDLVAFYHRSFPQHDEMAPTLPLKGGLRRHDLRLPRRSCYHPAFMRDFDTFFMLLFGILTQACKTDDCMQQELRRFIPKLHIAGYVPAVFQEKRQLQVVSAVPYFRAQRPDSVLFMSHRLGTDTLPWRLDEPQDRRQVFLYRPHAVDFWHVLGPSLANPEKAAIYDLGFATQVSQSAIHRFVTKNTLKLCSRLDTNNAASLLSAHLAGRFGSVFTLAALLSGQQ